MTLDQAKDRPAGPLVAGAFLAAVVAGFPLIATGKFAAIGLTVILLAMPLSLLVALPIAFGLDARNALNKRSSAILGALVGSLPLFATFLTVYVTRETPLEKSALVALSQMVAISAATGGFGTLGGLAFWHTVKTFRGRARAAG